MSSFISKSTLTLSPAPCRDLPFSGALSAASLRFIINFEMKFYGF